MQHKIDAIDYPCTHQYTLEGLEPIGHLKKRLDMMPGDFFEGDSFLDIGCNKGFFSLKAKQSCKYVEAIDNTPEYVVLCRDLGINTKQVSFRQYNPDRMFDRIMIGNVLHYMYRECGTWDFIIKLAAITTIKGLVLIEAPTGMECKDMKGVFSKELEKGFNHDTFMNEMSKFFTLKTISNSPSPDRYIMLFERKQEPYTTYEVMARNTIGKIVKESDESIVYNHNNETIVKIQGNNSVKDQIRFFITSHSPISNGVKTWIYDQDGFVGWTEKYEDKKPLRYFKRQEECWQQICRHNVFLARLGYTDIDTATLNFFDDLTMFDKGGICHVEDLHRLCVDDIDSGWYFTMLKNSYNIPLDLKMIQKALKTRDSFEIEKMYSSFLKPKIKQSRWRLFK